MATSVYLSNDKIQAVTGNVSGGTIVLEKACERQIPEGCFLNGMITDEALLLEQIQAFWEENRLPKKDIFLMVYGTQFMMKTVKLPKMKDAQIQNIMPKEFADMGNTENTVCDYMFLDEDKETGMQNLLGVMAEKTFIEIFVNLFEKLGIRLSGFGPGRDAEIRLMGFLPHMMEETCILQILNGMNVSSILWSRGQYLYASDTRIYSDRGTEGWGMEMARNTNAILQFYAGLKRPHPIEKIYIGGFSGEEKAVYGEYSRNYCSLEAEFLNGEGVVKADPQEFSEYLVAVGSLVRGRKNINLYEQYWKTSPKRLERIRLLKRCAIPGAVLVCCLAVTAGMLVVKIKKQDRLDEVTAAMQEPSYQEKYRDSQALILEMDGLKHKLASVKNVSESLLSYPRVNGTVMDTIGSCGRGVVTSEVQSYVAETGALELYAVAAQVTDINVFIDNLKASGLFRAVEYSGYGFVENDQTYNINVVCYMASTAGRQGED